jgi:hypothetical protein
VALRLFASFLSVVSRWLFVLVDRVVGSLGWRLRDLGLDGVGGRLGEMMFGGVRILILILI